MTSITIDGESLTFEEVLAVAYGNAGEPKVTLADSAKNNVDRCARAVGRLIERGDIAYGITTGFGAFKDKITSTDEKDLVSEHIMESHEGDLSGHRRTRYRVDAKRGSGEEPFS